MYIFTDTGTADREVLLYANVLKKILADLIENGIEPINGTRLVSSEGSNMAAATAAATTNHRHEIGHLERRTR